MKNENCIVMLSISGNENEKGNCTMLCDLLRKMKIGKREIELRSI